MAPLCVIPPFFPILFLVHILPLFLQQANVAHSHSFTIVPRGDFKSFRKPECRLGGPPHSPTDKCEGPCIAKSSWQYHWRHRSTTYSRGQRVRMVWTRNNHHGGFVRFTLVPEAQRMNRTAHDRYAFRYACFDSDRVPCPFKRCGTDIPRLMYRTWVTIPTIFPDGKYVLGWSWYGGVSMKKSYFGDYWSCSDIVIKGGPLTDSYQPRFNPGENIDYVKRRRRNQCYSVVNSLDVCSREPCLGLWARYMRPKSFSNRRKPAPLLSEWLMPSPSPSPGSKPVTAPEAPSASPSPSTSGPASPSPSPSEPALMRVRLTKFFVLDIERDEIVAKKFPTTVRFQSRMPKMTFVAEAKGPVKAVNFFINDRFIRSELRSPFSCFGDVDMEYYHWRRPIFKKWIKVTVRVTGEIGTAHVKAFWVRLFPKA